MLVTAYILPWMTGAVWLVLLDSLALRERELSPGILQTPTINWPRVLGYGFFLGNFICAAAIYAVHAVLQQLSITAIAVIMIGLSVAGLFLIRHRYRKRRFDFIGRLPLLDGDHKLLVSLLLALILLHLLLAGLELLSRPVLPWDAWTTWTYRAKIWFLNQQLSSLVGPEAWLTSTNPGTYTIDAHTYPAIVSLIQLWPVQVYGYWSDSLAVLPGLLAGIAIALALYGQGRSLGWPPLTVLVAVYMLLSIPLLDAHLALAGYADLWLSGFAGLGFMALLQWTQSNDRSQLLLGLLLLILGLLIKREGMIWTLAGLLLVSVYLLPWQLLLAIVTGLVLAVVSGHSLLEVPVLGKLGYENGVLYLAQLGVFPLQLQDISTAVATNLIFHSSWNLLTVYLAAALLLVFLPLCRPIKWTLLWFLLLVSSVIAGIFLLTEEGRWAQDNTALNRIIIQVLPALMFSLFMVWQMVWQNLFSPANVRQPETES